MCVHDMRKYMRIATNVYILAGTSRLRLEDAHEQPRRWPARMYAHNVAMRAPLVVLRAQASSGGPKDLPEPPHMDHKNEAPNVDLIFKD